MTKLLLGFAAGAALFTFAIYMATQNENCHDFRIYDTKESYCYPTFPFGRECLALGKTDEIDKKDGLPWIATMRIPEREAREGNVVNWCYRK